MAPIKRSQSEVSDLLGDLLQGDADIANDKDTQQSRTVGRPYDLESATTPAQIILAGLDGLGVLRLPEYKRSLAESLIQLTLDLPA